MRDRASRRRTTARTVLARGAANEIGQRRVTVAVPPCGLERDVGRRSRCESWRHVDRGLEHRRCASDQSEREQRGESDLEINLKTSPEIVTGSTRLKAGTATKVALNIISTGVMARLGRVHGNLMIDLQPTNKKLRERAIGLVSRLAGCDRESARSRLERADWNLREALKEE